MSIDSYSFYEYRPQYSPSINTGEAGKKPGQIRAVDDRAMLGQTAVVCPLIQA